MRENRRKLGSMLGDLKMKGNDKLRMGAWALDHESAIVDALKHMTRALPIFEISRFERALDQLRLVRSKQIPKRNKDKR